MTEPIEENTEAPEAVTEVISTIEVVTPIKSKKARSDLQLKALANARQAAYKVRAEKAELKKAKNETKKTQEVPEEVSIELPESHQEIQDEVPDNAKDDSEEVPENENENIRDVKKAKPVVEESHIDRIERHAERQEFNDYITNLIDERVRYKPIVKGKFKMVDGVYVIR